MTAQQDTTFRISGIRINDMVTPLGTDIKEPLISWTLESDGKDMKQACVRILAGREPESSDCWDSGLLETDRSIGIRYAGRPLQAQTRYHVTVCVQDQRGQWAKAGTWFETGLMDGKIGAWHGAKWIGAPEYAVASGTISAFVLETTFQIRKGYRAGIIFGADDPRLMDRYKNEMLLEGENEIRFVIDLETQPASLEIYRRGYAPDDHGEEPLFRIPLKDLCTGEQVITKENMREPHKLLIRVPGNGAYTWLDGHPVDESFRETPRGKERSPRCLNPLGIVDVTTYPRLCSVGYYAGEGSVVSFPEGIRLRHFREPGNEFAVLDPQGKEMAGESREVKDPSCHSIPVLRRRFSVTERPVKARLYATARGIYQCYVNGQGTDDVFFAPGASQFDRHLKYQTYDITDRIREGDNTIGCILSSGWWSDAFSFRTFNANYWGDRPSFLGMLVLSFRDGSQERIVTDAASWEYFGEGPFRYAGFFQGEHFDARRKGILEDFLDGRETLPGIKKPEIITPVCIPESEGIFPGAACWPEVNRTQPALTGDFQAPVRIVKTLTAQSVSEPREGVLIYDLGQEIAGVPVIRFHEKAGQKITIRYGEMLYPDMERYKGLEGLMLQANLRDASSTDQYICSGEDGETWQPQFTFHGYRYVEITGAANPPAVSDVKSVLLSSVEKITGSFTCSDPLVNRLVENVRYSQYCNFISIPTDCPQRNERMGWLGDTCAFSKTADLQSSVRNFYLRNLEAMADLQRPDGRLPAIAPFGGGFGGITYESALILMAWELYQHYGDDTAIRTYYPAMTGWMESMSRMGFPGRPEVSLTAWLGDWLAPEPADEYLIFNAFHYRNAVLMVYFAGMLGYKEDEEKYLQTARETKDYWNRTFVDPATGMTRNADGSVCDAQGSYAVALSCDVFAETNREKAFERLAARTKEGAYTVRTGFFGTGALNEMLSRGGYSDIARKTLTQRKCPGWLYPVTQGATTIWERWNSYTAQDGFGEHNAMNSFNHYSLGSVVSWLYEHVLGIQRDEQYPGYTRFILKPEIGTFSFAEGRIETPHGRIESSWEKKGEKATFRCTIPANTAARLILNGKETWLGSGTYVFEDLKV